jgi:hypothetical protein
MTFETEIIFERKDTWYNRLALFFNVFEMWEYEVPVEVEFDPSADIPAKTWGPPEDCHDGESHTVEILSVISLLNGQEMISQLTDQQIDKLENEADDWAADRRD